MRRIGTVLIGMVLLAAFCASAQEEPEIVVETDRSRIYEGERLLYRITLNRIKGPVQPDFSAFEDFELEQLGEPETFNYSMHSNFNGRIREIVRFGITLNYALTPKRSGTLTIPAPVVEVAGKTLKGRTLTLEVVPPGEQDLAFLSIEVDRVDFYLLQPFTVTLAVDVKSLPAQYREESPVSLRNHVPHLSVPWGNVPQGLSADPMPELNWLSPFTRSGRGFGINGHKARSISLFDSARYQRYDLESRRITRPDASGKDAEYVRYTLKRRFVPKQIGEYSFGPVTLKGGFVSGINARRELQLEDVYAISPAVAVRVRDAPLEGRPDSFTGAVGWFELDADLKPRQARVGDPLTLTVTLTGEGTLDMASAPEIAELPLVKEAFTVYDATEETDGRKRIFTYSIRPSTPEIEVFPPLEVAFFDVAENRYVTLQTESIPIEIEPAISADEDETFPASLENGGKRKLEFLKEGIFPNVVVLSSQRDETVHPEIWVAVLAGMVFFYGASLLGVRMARRRFGDPDLQRRRGAPGHARTVLRQAKVAFKQGRPSESRALLSGALTGFVADVTASSAEGVTHGDVQQRLEPLGLSGETAGKLAAIVEDCDAAKYGASASEVDSLLAESESALASAVRELRSLGRLK